MMLGVLMAFNEVDVIRNSVSCLLGASHHVIVFDHGSSDGTVDLLRSEFPDVEIRRLSRRRVHFASIWRHISAYIHSQISAHGWVTWLAADEILRTPIGELPTISDLEKVAKRWDVIRPRPREFWMTELDDQHEPDPVKRMRFYRWRDDVFAPRSWRIRLTGIMEYGLHRPDKTWKRDSRLLLNRWILDHYPVRSEEQGRAKVRMRPHQPIYRQYANAPDKSMARRASDLIRIEPFGRANDA